VSAEPHSVRQRDVDLIVHRPSRSPVQPASIRRCRGRDCPSCAARFPSALREGSRPSTLPRSAPALRTGSLCFVAIDSGGHEEIAEDVPAGKAANDDLRLRCRCSEFGNLACSRAGGFRRADSRRTAASDESGRGQSAEGHRLRNPLDCLSRFHHGIRLRNVLDKRRANLAAQRAVAVIGHPHSARQRKSSGGVGFEPTGRLSAARRVLA
jgi:hypothetical protein